MVEHKYLKTGVMKPRLYQEIILGTAIKKNTLVVLPTGLGKTHIAALLAAKRLGDYPDSKVLFLAPTKPLVEQHSATLREALAVGSDEFKVFTGAVAPEKREDIYNGARVLFATPQVIQNDIISKTLSLENVSLLVVDEAHRASGEYPYGFIAKKYVEAAKNPRILALTASPGGNKEAVENVCKELFIEAIESRGRADEDVKEYVKQRAFEWIEVELPTDFRRIKAHLESMLKERLEGLKKAGILNSSSVSSLRKKQILILQGQLAAKAPENPDYYMHLSTLAAVMKLYHSLELIETQGVAPLCEYFEKLEVDKSKAAAGLVVDYRFKSAAELAGFMRNAGEDHPKLDKLLELLAGEGKVIVFANYRSSVNTIMKVLKEHGISAKKLIGQAKDGITQKEQVVRIEEFKEGKFRVLVCTSVGEEGLDIPAVDRVVFYEPVPSAIRSIQRSGRTARHRPGKVSILVAKGTRDQAYYWSAYRKEEKMKDSLRGVEMGKAQGTLDKYAEQEGIIIFADSREAGSGIIKKISALGAEVRMKNLDVADFQLSTRVGVERKSASDFVQSLVDGRLMKQAKSLSEQFEKPLLIVEGGSLYNIRNIHPNAIRGSLASLAIDFGVPILYSENVDDTAAFLVVIAKREQLDLKKEIVLRGERKPLGTKELQQYVVESLPSVGPSLAKRMLERFGTVEKVMTAKEGELQKIDKLGEKKAKGIRKVLEQEY
ncbi:MAG: DEAD/DEAH box helicase [archaeon]